MASLNHDPPFVAIGCHHLLRREHEPNQRAHWLGRSMLQTARYRPATRARTALGLARSGGEPQSRG
eukprot:1628208-Alexandrium_andersonii.AAC.1